MTIVDPVILKAFLNESRENIENLDYDLTELESNPGNQEAINSVFRSLHTIKGNSSFLDLADITAVAHAAESLLDEVRSGRRTMTQEAIDLVFLVVDILRSMTNDPEQIPDTSSLVAKINQYKTRESDDAILAAEVTSDEIATKSTKSKPINEIKIEPRSANVPRFENFVKIEEKKVERMASLVNELELLRYTMERLTGDFEENSKDFSDIKISLDLASTKVSRITSELGSLVFGARLVPVNHVFRRFPRIVRDLAEKLGKEVELRILNGSAELDKTIVEAIADPMTHLIRNAVDHGIEEPERRQSQGKNAKGIVTLNSFVLGNSVIVEIKDDGKGMDAGLIVRKAIEKGIVPRAKAAEMSDAEKLGLIFAPGFSTAEKITDISGRGVGMDVVKSNINKLKGTVNIESEVNVGTTIQLRFPLSVVVARCLYVNIERICCAIPLSQMEESIHIGKGELFSRPPSRLRSGEETMSVYSLEELLHGKFQVATGIEEIPAIRVRRKDGKLIALLVDSFSFMEEAIIHSIDSYISSIPGIQGGIIRRDGSVSVALSIDSLLEGTFEKSPLAYTISREKKKVEVRDLQSLIQEAQEITGGIFEVKLN